MILTHTSHYILRRRISMCTHYSGGDVSVVSFWTVFGQTKIRQLRSVILIGNANSIMGIN